MKSLNDKLRVRPMILALASAFVVGQPASAATDRPARIEFVPATLVAGQGVRVTLVNLSDPDTLTSKILPVTCSVQLRFSDKEGNVVGDLQTFEVAAGGSKLVVGPGVPVAPSISASTGPYLLRATVLPSLGPCLNVIRASFEVYNTATGSTLFASPGPINEFNPQPDPPGRQ